MTQAPEPAAKRLSTSEFIALMGMMFATIAFSIDAMLPVLPEIAQELTPDDLTLAQLVLTSFIIGMGVGTLFTGPLSDAFGRKPVIFAGAMLYIAGSFLAWMAPSLELLIAARVLQGLGAAGPRVVAMALVRDLYSGREMARIMSFVMLVFTIMPAIAPLIGTGIIALFDWRAIFLAYVLFSVLTVAWLMLRQPETLPRGNRKTLNLPSLWADIRETLALRQMQLSILVQSLIYGALFGTLSSVQQIFDLTYDMGDAFPWLFGAIALLAAPCAPINARLVVQLGMRPLVRRALYFQVAAAALFVASLTFGAAPSVEVWFYFAWTATVFMMMGFTIGNLNALALEPLGHIAGMAASLMGAISTIVGATFGAIIGQLYDGTALPLAIGTALLAGTGALIMRRMPREAL